jgi:hypothetical protein
MQMADEEPEPTRDLVLTPMTRIQFQPIGGALYMLVVDGEPVGDFNLAPESAEWFHALPTAEQYGQTLDEMRLFFQSQGVTL